jgi:hypothetical protein
VKRALIVVAAKRRGDEGEVKRKGKRESLNAV